MLTYGQANPFFLLVRTFTRVPNRTDIFENRSDLFLNSEGGVRPPVASAEVGDADHGVVAALRWWMRALGRQAAEDLLHGGVAEKTSMCSADAPRILDHV